MRNKSKNMQRGLSQITKIPQSKENDQDCKENLQVGKFLQTIQTTED